MATNRKKAKKNPLAVPIGVIAGILAVIGLIAVVKFAIGAVDNITNKTAEKAKYEEFLLPVVMFDPDPFDDLTQADVSQLLNSAVWALLMSEDGTDKYSYAEGDTFGIVVPQTDIELYFNGLFGTEINIASLHSSIDMSEYEITYDAALKSYSLPVTGVESAYTPKVYGIEKQGSSVILSVGYISNKAWVQLDGDEITAPEPDKYMNITLRERNGGTYVSSIQAVDGQEVIGTTEPNRAPETEAETTAAPVETTAEATTEAVAETDENGEEVTTEEAEAAEESDEEETTEEE